jgi:hypothetical protein
LSREAREVLADWLMLFGAVALLIALFLPWSHQRPLPGFSHSLTAWQVYSVVDVLLAVLAGGLLAVALLGGRAARVVVLLAAAVAVAFTVHALSVPPSNGAIAGAAGSGAGEVVAIAALGIAIAGLAISFTSEPILE